MKESYEINWEARGRIKGKKNVKLRRKYWEKTFISDNSQTADHKKEEMKWERIQEASPLSSYEKGFRTI